MLAAINEIETDYGRNLNVSSAGALGWMQFIPSSWRIYGVDANSDGQKDPYNPVDAIFAAARYLKAAGGDGRPAARDLRLQPRRLVRRLGPDARAPDLRPARRPGRVAHRPHPGPLPGPRAARYADDLPSATLRRLGRKVRRAHNAAKIVNSNDHRRSINIYTPPRRSGDRGQRRRRQEGRQRSKKLGRYIVLQDVYGNRYTYAHLGSGLQALPGARSARRPGRARTSSARAQRPQRGAAPAEADGTRERRHAAHAPAAADRVQLQPSAAQLDHRPGVTEKERLFADPARAQQPDARRGHGQLRSARPASRSSRSTSRKVFRLKPVAR